LQGAPWTTASSLRLLFCGEERRSRGLELGDIAAAAFHGREKNRAQGTAATDRESRGRPWEVSLGGGAEGKGGALGGEELSSLMQGRRAPWEKDLLAAVGTREEEKGALAAVARGTRSKGRRGSWSRGGEGDDAMGESWKNLGAMVGAGVPAAMEVAGRWEPLAAVGRREGGGRPSEGGRDCCSPGRGAEVRPWVESQAPCLLP
jgi:hypothetical protein